MFKKILVRLTLVLMSTVVFFNIAMADNLNDFSRDLEQQIIQTREAIADGKAPSAKVKADEEYFFRRFWLRLRGKVGIQLPGIYNLQVIPEMEMLFERTLPDGYTGYKP